MLQLRDIASPVPGRGEVLVRVRAAGADPGVWHMMTGVPYLARVLGFGSAARGCRSAGWPWPAWSRQWARR